MYVFDGVLQLQELKEHLMNYWSLHHVVYCILAVEYCMAVFVLDVNFVYS